MRDVTTQEGFIPVMRGRVWYRVPAGDERTPLMMLHGGNVAASGYFPPLLALAEERPVLLYDHLEGQHLAGLQDVTSAAAAVTDAPGFERFLHDVDQVQAVIGTRQMHILGHSWGAPLAFEYALRRPEAVISLIVDVVEPALLDRRAFNPGQAHFSMVEKLAELNRAGRLAQITVPAMLICRRQTDCQPELTDWYQELLPGAELLAVPRAKGVHGTEAGEHFFRAVSEFLRRAEGRAGLAPDAPPLALAA